MDKGYSGARHRGLVRLLDANFNRSREGLRVCEDICRFVAEDKQLTSELKSIRHGITRALKSMEGVPFLESRDVLNDGGKGFSKLERKRSGWKDLYFANLERSKESLRVLEEGVKLLEKPDQARVFKKLRFKLYALEKKSLGKL